jgi:hypothetical protein
MTKNVSILTLLVFAASSICHAQQEAVGARQLDGLARSVQLQSPLKTPEEVAKSESQSILKRAGTDGIKTLDARVTCPVKSSLSIPSSIQGTLTTSSCIDPVISSYEDVYSFSGTSGQTVTIDMSSTRFSVFLYLNGPSGEFTSFSTITSFLSSGTSSQRIVYTLARSGVYTIDAESLYSYTSGQPTTGSYTISISAGSGGTCAYAGTLTCGSTVNGALTTSSCNTGGTSNAYVDFYHLGGTAGSAFTITLNATRTSLLVTVQDPVSGNILASNTGTGSVTLTYTPTYTGDHAIGVVFLTAFSTGTYSLSVACSGGTACATGGSNLCLSNRFRITTAWATPDGRSGMGTAGQLTSASGTFWFFGANATEVIAKIVNGCSANSRYWVFAGGLTNVKVTLTVVDTNTGVTQTYVNPLNANFQTVADAAAFATCP